LKLHGKNSKQISAFMDGELPDHQMEEIRSHLTVCTVCRKQLEMMQQADRFIKVIPEIEPSKSFEPTFWKKIATMEEKKSRWSLSSFFHISYKPFAATALAVMLVAGIVLWKNAPHPPEFEEITIAENLELFQNFQEIHHLDLLENWETIMRMDEKS